MAIGEFKLGQTRLGHIPEPEEFENQTEEKKDEKYKELYNEVEELSSEVKKARSEASKWRSRTWFWRIGSFVIGHTIGIAVGIVI